MLKFLPGWNLTIPQGPARLKDRKFGRNGPVAVEGWGCAGCSWGNPRRPPKSIGCSGWGQSTRKRWGAWKRTCTKGRCDLFPIFYTLCYIAWELLLMHFQTQSMWGRRAWSWLCVHFTLLIFSKLRRSYMQISSFRKRVRSSHNSTDWAPVLCPAPCWTQWETRRGPGHCPPVSPERGRLSLLRNFTVQC